MRGLPIIILLLIPAFIALGHDCYLFYQEHLNPGVLSLDLIVEKFKFSALGYIWTTYDVESYKNAVGSLEADQWSLLDYILTFKAFYVGLGFAGIFILLFAILALFGRGPFTSAAQGAQVRSFSPKSKKRR